MSNDDVAHADIHVSADIRASANIQVSVNARAIPTPVQTLKPTK